MWVAGCAVDPSGLPSTGDMGVEPTDAGSDLASPLDMQEPRDMGPDRPDLPVVDAPTCEDGCPLGCSPTAPGECATLAPSNVDESEFVSGLPDLVIANNQVYRTTSCADSAVTEASLVPSNDPERPGGQYCVLRVGSLTIEAGVSWTVYGDWPLIVLAEGPIVVDGTIDVAAHRETAGGGRSAAGPGGFRGAVPGVSCDACGPGRGADGTTLSVTEEAASSGGGGGSGCASGGAGGASGAVAGGAAGMRLPAAYAGTPLRGGSGGGIGGGAAPGDAGAGGGGLQLTSLTSVSVAGRILGGGGGGLDPSGAGSDDSAAGSGGGAGGVFLLEAPMVSVTGQLDVAGGGGSGGASGSTAGNRGMDAFEVAIASPGSQPSGGLGASTSGSGGSGGFDMSAEGGVGTDAMAADSNGGGGGGGGGCVVVRGMDTSLGGASLSPRSTTSVLPLLVE